MHNMICNILHNIIRTTLHNMICNILHMIQGPYNVRYTIALPNACINSCCLNRHNCPVVIRLL